MDANELFASLQSKVPEIAEDNNSTPFALILPLAVEIELLLRSKSDIYIDGTIDTNDNKIKAERVVLLAIKVVPSKLC